MRVAGKNEAIGKTSLEHQYCGCNRQLIESLSDDIKGVLKWPCLPTEEVYLRTLEGRPQLTCGKTYCPLSDSGIKAFIERVVGERESLCNKLMNDTQYVQ